MNRRGFFKALGAAVAIMATGPALPVRPIATVVTVDNWMDLNVINAMAFLIHGEAFPEHREHYRMKAFKAMRRIRWPR